MLLSNAHVCETPQLVCITRSMTKYSNKNHSYRNSRNLPKNYEFTLINTKAPNTPITRNANDEQVLRTERVLYTQCNQSTNQKSCTFYCQNPSNRVIYICMAWIVLEYCLRQAAAFIRTYILKIECYGYLFVYFIAYTHIRARIKSQPSHLTRSRSVYVWQQVVVYCHTAGAVVLVREQYA